MKLKLIFLLLLAMPFVSKGQEQQFTTQQFKEDFNFFWRSIDEDYGYFFKKQTDWAKVKEIYSPMIDTIKTRAGFVTVLENALNEIYDHHAGLNTNNNTSRRLVPSRTDIWAEYVAGKPVIIQVRKNFGAEKVGMRAGMEVIAINDIPVDKAIEPFIGKSLKQVENEARSYALRLALAGDHIQARKLTLKYKGQTKDYFPDADGMLLEHIKYASTTESKIINGIGYIKINDCLWNNDLIHDFDSVMQAMKDTRSLILDMRETPGGGNTTVARAILGWFIDKEQFYQKHELYAEEKAYGIKRSWEEIVSPRKGKYYSKPLIVLADHWTGSLGEGITIGFDGMKRARIVGTPLARLCGATYPYQLPNTKINFGFPVERLYHINGTPREEFKPSVMIDYEHLPPTINNDRALDKALELLK